LKKYNNALQDHNLVILLYSVEVEILNEQQIPERDTLLKEAAVAYRARGNCYREMGEPALASADKKRAERLEAQAKKLAEAVKKNGSASGGEKSTGPGKKGAGNSREEKVDAQKKPTEERRSAKVRLVNEWKEPVTVVVSGVAYHLRAGEVKLIPRPVGPFTYEVQVRHHWARGILEPGKTFTIRIRDR
jgi:hypothetical protein